MKPARAIITAPRTSRILGLGLALLLAAACTPKPDPAATAAGPAAATGARQVVVVKKTLRKAEMSPEDKQLHDWSIELKKSHEIFREVWAHIWEDRLQNPMSVFFEIERLLQNHKKIEDGHFTARRTECPGRASEVELLRGAGGAILGAVFYRLPCRGTELLPGRTEIARVHKDGRRQTWTFINEQMPRAAGQSMAFLRETTRCVSSLDERARMTALQCQNLGQNRDTELHLNFSEFKYQKNAATLVEVQGKKFKLLTTAVCDSPKFCTSLKVPLAGSIEIFEDTVSELVREERRQAMLKKEREEEAKAALELHKKHLAEMQKKAPPAAHATVPGAPQPGVGAIVPGQTLDAFMTQPTQEPQFGEAVAPEQAGPPGFAPRPVGADGIAHDPVMEFDHGGGAPEMTAEEYNARLGQPPPAEETPEFPREAHSAPIER